MRVTEELVLDGNALAGPLTEIFASEATAARVTCACCESVGALATARLYRGAGSVLRCARCDAILMRIVGAPGRTYIELTGIRCMEIPTPEQ